MAKEWKMVRLSARTYDALRVMMQRLDETYARGQLAGAVDDVADGISLDAMVWRLVRHVQNDRRRMREARARRIARRREERLRKQ